jgi:NAD(P) transhydrogenase subunit beta
MVILGGMATTAGPVFGAFALLCVLIVNPGATQAFYAMCGIGLALGVLFVLPIGGADMPVVISLLNSYAGLAAAATGFALANNVLIIAGALDGSSGLVLSILMCKAMNRSFTSVLFGAVGRKISATGASESRQAKAYTVDDALTMLSEAQRVVVAPGYGLAVAQAQHHPEANLLRR